MQVISFTMLASIIFPIAICLSYVQNVHGVAVPATGSASRKSSASALPTLPDALTLPPLTTPNIITRVGPDGYKYTIDMANAVHLSTLVDVKTAGYARPGGVSPNPAVRVRDILRRQGCGTVNSQSSNTCQDSSFENHTSPGSPHSDDCWVIADGMYTEYLHGPIINFSIFRGSDWNGLVWYGTCIFGAQTQNIFKTWVGVKDISDLTADGISRFQYVFVSFRLLFFCRILLIQERFSPLCGIYLKA